MGKPPEISQDEQGFLTLELPSQGGFASKLPGWIKMPAFFAAINRLGRRRIILISGVIAGSIWLFLAVSFLFPSNLNFSTAGETCAFNPVLLPRLNRLKPSQSFLPESRSNLNLFGYPIFSAKTCLTAVIPPPANTKESASISWLHIPFIMKNININIGEPTVVSARLEPNSEISVAGNLEFNLDTADQIYAYKISGNDRSALCDTNEQTIACPLSVLSLTQGTEYELVLERWFKEKHLENLITIPIKTLDPVIITKTSIKNQSTAYDKPQKITITTNKQINTIDRLELRSKSDDIVGTTVEHNDKTITISWHATLPRETEFILKIEQISATDGSQLEQPYELKFATSGGPAVTSSSIGGSRVQPWANIVLGFDSELKADLQVSKFARIEIGGRIVPASISIRGAQIIINPLSNLPRCTAFKIIIEKGLINKHGVGDGKAWSKNSRTLCQVAFSIGNSVNGRQITAYRFGNGSSQVVLVGGMHGNERSSVYLLRSFISYLEDHAGEIPSGRSIIIIPNSNPDGFAAGSRTNANGVDLNRNFPANDWQSSVQMPGGINSPKGGGNSPGDQPETKALMSFISNNNPRVVLTYHAVARVVISNDAGDSATIGRKYASAAGYRFTTDAGSDDEFGYATTGEFEDWLADKKGIAGILVELSSMSANQFSAHRTALMNIVRL